MSTLEKIGLGLVVYAVLAGLTIPMVQDEEDEERAAATVILWPIAMILAFVRGAIHLYRGAKKL